MALEDALVAILGSRDTSPVGAGIVVAPNLVLTCAHVVNQAHGRPKDATGRPPGALKLRFHASGSKVVSAQVDSPDDAWSDPPAWRAPSADLCVLRFEDDGDIKYAVFDPSIDLLDPPNRKFRAAGYPPGWQVDFANGDIIGKDQNGLYLLRPDAAALAAYSTSIKPGLLKPEQRAPGLIHEGFSGGPVEVGGAVVGLLSGAREEIHDATAYMIPIHAFPKRIVQRELPYVHKLYDPSVLQELLRDPSKQGRSTPTTEALLHIFRYFLEHKCVYESTDSEDSLVRNLRASPELHLLGPGKIKSAVLELKNLGLIVHKQETLAFGAPSTIFKWTLAEPRKFTSRVPSLRQEIEDFHRRIDQDRPIVMHEGLAKLGGADDIFDSLARVRLGHTVRWLTYHGLSDDFQKSLQDLGTRCSHFDLRVLMCAPDASKELREHAPLKSHETSVEEGRKKLSALRELMQAHSENIAVEIRSYREPRAGYVRGLLVTDADDKPIKLSLVSWRWPSGRGTEGERLVMRSSDQGICSIAYLFRDHFDSIWVENPTASEEQHATAK